MPVYVALLRGINVGGHNRIQMSELKQLFESLGLKDVQTYIQSGNVLFISDEASAAVRARIEQALKQKMGTAVDVIVRSAEELHRIVTDCPLSDEAILQAQSTSEGESHYVALLQAPPTPADVQRLESAKGPSETYVVVGCDIHLLFGESIRNSRLASQLAKLSTPATTRNWKIMSKLASMAQSMVDANQS